MDELEKAVLRELADGETPAEITERVIGVLLRFTSYLPDDIPMLAREELGAL